MLKQFVEVLFWGGFYAIPYSISSLEDKEQLRQPTTFDWVMDILKLTLFTLGIIAIVKLIKRKWRF